MDMTQFEFDFKNEFASELTNSSQDSSTELK